MDADGLTVDARPGGQSGHFGECVDELRPAVGVAGIIDGVDPDEDVGRAERFGEGQGKRQENRVLRASRPTTRQPSSPL